MSNLWHALQKVITASIARSSAMPALLSPEQGIAFSYLELAQKAKGLSIGLQERGVGPGSIVATDLPNVAEGILLHLACARLGAAVATAKDAAKFHQLPSIACAVLASNDSWLSQMSFLAPSIGQSELQSMMTCPLTASSIDNSVNDDTIDRPHGYFGSVSPLMHSAALKQGQDMIQYLSIIPNDRVCVSITLYHAFGIGSACSAALQAGATIVLPGVGGIHGCGVPSQRAELTLHTLESQKCTLLFCDTPTLKAMDDILKQETDLSALRGGVCKTGSGTDILDENVELKGVKLATLGKRS